MKLLSVTTQSCNPVLVPDTSLSQVSPVMLEKICFSLLSPTWSLWGWVQLYIKGFTDCWCKIMDLSYFESQDSLGFIPVIFHETDFLRFLFLFFFFHLLKLKLTVGFGGMLSHPSK